MTEDEMAKRQRAAANLAWEAVDSITVLAEALGEDTRDDQPRDGTADTLDWDEPNHHDDCTRDEFDPAWNYCPDCSVPINSRFGDLQRKLLRIEQKFNNRGETKQCPECGARTKWVSLTGTKLICTQCDWWDRGVEQQ